MTLQGTPVLILKDDTSRTTGKDAVSSNIAAAKSAIDAYVISPSTGRFAVGVLDRSVNAPPTVLAALAVIS